MPIFRVKSVKIYTGQKKFTLTPSVASVTIIRYGIDRRIVLQFVRLTTGHAILAKGQQPMLNVISYSKATEIKILTSL